MRSSSIGKGLRLLVLGAVLVSLLVVTGISKTLPKKLQWEVYLTNMTETEVSVNWKTTVKTTAEITYGLISTYRDTGKLPHAVKTAGQPGYFHHVRLTGLQPDSNYLYRIQPSATNKVSYDLHSFTTPAKGSEPFTFLVYGDTRTFPDRHRLVTTAMGTDPLQPEFVLHTGDLIESPIESRWNSFFWALQPLGTSVPFYPCLGNHEENSETYYRAFELPRGGGYQNERWYSFDYHNLHVICLDSNSTSLGFSGMNQQRNWLKKDLSKTDKPFIVVFFHHPIYSSEYDTAKNAGLEALWHSLFDKYGVDVVFSGHVHSYERLASDGITYIVTGGGGAPSGSIPSKSDRSQAQVDDSLHYVRVNVDQDSMQVQMVEVARVLSDGGAERAGASARIVYTGVIKDQTVIGNSEKNASSN